MCIGSRQSTVRSRQSTVRRRQAAGEIIRTDTGRYLDKHRCVLPSGAAHARSILSASWKRVGSMPGVTCHSWWSGWCGSFSRSCWLTLQSTAYVDGLIAATLSLTKEAAST